MLRYSLLRTMLLFGCLLALYLVGVRNPLLLMVLTGVTSIALSYVVLKGPREQMARDLAQRAARRMRNEPVDAFEQDGVTEDREAERNRGDDVRREP